MAQSHTVVAALKFKGGVIIAADSQVSDDVVSVRWLMEKPEHISPHPVVVAFSGSAGRGIRARDALQGAGFLPSHFKSAVRVTKVFDAVLSPIYADIQTSSKPPYKDWREIALAGLAVFWAGGEPHIIEREMNNDSCPHVVFHAIGSGGNTAYAVYRTLGGSRLATIEEPKAIMAMLRIIRTVINVEFAGVSEPIVAFVIREGKGQTTPARRNDG
jgi:ATP-dependent protease HslVU (ClpYQ) peptidase subunit